MIKSPNKKHDPEIILHSPENSEDVLNLAGKLKCRDFQEDSDFPPLNSKNILLPKKAQKSLNIKEASSNFLKLMDFAEAKITLEDFQNSKANLKKQISPSLDLPEWKKCFKLHREYCLKEKSRKNYKNKNWNEAERNLLLFMVACFMALTKLPAHKFTDSLWSDISDVFVNKKPEVCKYKFNLLLRSHPTQAAWTDSEDKKLKELISLVKRDKNNRIKWAEIARRFAEMTSGGVKRLGKHCRERWKNHLDPELKKGNWSQEEDIHLLEKTLIYGFKWSKISLELPGRNENAVKNRFLALVKSLSQESFHGGQSKNSHSEKIIEMLSKLKEKDTNQSSITKEQLEEEKVSKSQGDMMDEEENEKMEMSEERSFSEKDTKNEDPNFRLPEGNDEKFGLYINCIQEMVNSPFSYLEKEFSHLKTSIKKVEEGIWPDSNLLLTEENSA